jgi:hypothetical protein
MGQPVASGGLIGFDQEEECYTVASNSHLQEELGQAFISGTVTNKQFIHQ